MNALRPLLSGIVDYAGLFPPAGLDMAAAVTNYAAYRADPDAWMLGRFVVPVARLGELAEVLDTLLPAPDDEEPLDGPAEPWPIAALLGGNLREDAAAIDAFNAAHDSRAHIDTVEGKLSTSAAIAEAAALFSPHFAVFAEIPIDKDPEELVAAIAAAGINAKMRAGGVTPDAFPAAKDVIRFMRRCAAAKVQFKATAGLHHPIRAEHRLTYSADAPRGVMYGYLNVFLAAALLGELTDSGAVALLEEENPAAIEVSRDAIRWRGHELRADQAAAARDLIASSFGSCSFREPVDDLRALSLLE